MVTLAEDSGLVEFWNQSMMLDRASSDDRTWRNWQQENEADGRRFNPPAVHECPILIEDSRRGTGCSVGEQPRRAPSARHESSLGPPMVLHVPGRSPTGVKEASSGIRRRCAEWG